MNNNDITFEIGDKVWIDNICGDIPSSMIPNIRTPQVVEDVLEMPCSDGILQRIYLVGINLCFSQRDLRKA